MVIDGLPKVVILLPIKSAAQIPKWETMVPKRRVASVAFGPWPSKSQCDVDCFSQLALERFQAGKTLPLRAVGMADSE